MLGKSEIVMLVKYLCWYMYVREVRGEKKCSEMDSSPMSLVLPEPCWFQIGLGEGGGVFQLYFFPRLCFYLMFCCLYIKVCGVGAVEDRAGLCAEASLLPGGMWY